MTTPDIEHLERKIEALIREHVAEVRRRAAAAIERGVSRIAQPRRAPRTSRASTYTRRSGDDVAQLVERLFEAMCAHPGSTMKTLAPIVGATSRQLSRPAELLKRAGRVRSAGQKQAMRYFPMTSKAGR